MRFEVNIYHALIIEDNHNKDKEYENIAALMRTLEFKLLLGYFVEGPKIVFLFRTIFSTFSYMLS